MIKIAAIITIITLLSIVHASAQFSMPEFKNVEGKYVNEALGIEIMLPAGWSGIELPSILLTSSPTIGGFIAAPGGIEMTDISLGAPMMFLSVMDAKKVKEVKATPPSEELPTSIEEPQPREESKCKVLSFNLIEIDGAKGMEGIVECTMEDENGNPMQLKMKGLWASQEKDASVRTIQIMFTAKVDEYDRYVKDFDNALSTLSISGAKALSINTENEVVEKITINDTDLDIKIYSSSKINDFQFNEADKSISFKVEGDDGSIGMTDVYLSSVLKGPYTVTIDGEVVDTIPIVDEEGNEGIKIIYMHSIHRIKIVGTEVVPEFPIALPILALVTGVAIFMARNRITI